MAVTNLGNIADFLYGPSNSSNGLEHMVQWIQYGNTIVWPNVNNIPPGIYYDSTQGWISVSIDGTTWVTLKDKNIGATQIYNYGDNVTPQNTGYLYQWGNCYGFSSDSSAVLTTTSTQVDVTGVSPSSYNSNVFYVDPGGTNPSNWIADGSDPIPMIDLWGWDTGTNTARQGPCPSGWHVPTSAERNIIGDVSNLLGMSSRRGYGYYGYHYICNYFFIPSSGFFCRSGGDGSITSAPLFWCCDATYWEDTYVTPPMYGLEYIYAARYGEYSISTSVVSAETTSFGYPIRPFKNTPAIPDLTWKCLFRFNRQ